jgi:hypothetical protein
MSFTEEPEPAVGWRLWRLGGDHLRSWVVDYIWEPGENFARCLIEEPGRCQSSPGTDCKCGFWALWSPLHCLHRGRLESNGDFWALGMISGWGTVALHGKEGFRAERAALLCLFLDDVDGVAHGRKLFGKNWRLWRFLGFPPQVEPEPSQSTEQQAERLIRLRPVAESYGVTLLTLEAALRSGMLAELGATREAISEVDQFVTRMHSASA